MSISRRPEELFEGVKTRHRLLRAAGGTATVVGVILVAFVGYEWFVRGISHEVIALVSAAAILFGVQLLVLSALTSMLITLHREQSQRFDRLRE